VLAVFEVLGCSRCSGCSRYSSCSRCLRCSRYSWCYSRGESVRSGLVWGRLRRSRQFRPL